MDPAQEVIEIAPPTWTWVARLFAEFVPTDTSELVRMGTLLDGAIEFIRDRHPEMAAEFRAYLEGFEEGRLRADG
jgi:hypothetical protein